MTDELRSAISRGLSVYSKAKPQPYWKDGDHDIIQMQDDLYELAAELEARVSQSSMADSQSADESTTWSPGLTGGGN